MRNNIIVQKLFAYAEKIRIIDGDCPDLLRRVSVCGN